MGGLRFFCNRLVVWCPGAIPQGGGGGLFPIIQFNPVYFFYLNWVGSKLMLILFPSSLLLVLSLIN